MTQKPRRRERRGDPNKRCRRRPRSSGRCGERGSTTRDCCCFGKHGHAPFPVGGRVGPGEGARGGRDNQGDLPEPIFERGSTSPRATVPRGRPLSPSVLKPLGRRLQRCHHSFPASSRSLGWSSSTATVRAVKMVVARSGSVSAAMPDVATHSGATV